MSTNLLHQCERDALIQSLRAEGAPRTAINACMGGLAVLEHNTGVGWRALLNQTEPEADHPTADTEIGNVQNSLVP